jgi:hypothetical protein
MSLSCECFELLGRALCDGLHPSYKAVMLNMCVCVCVCITDCDQGASKMGRPGLTRAAGQWNKINESNLNMQEDTSFRP